MSQSDADRRAAAAVVAHHTQLSTDLAGHVAALRDVVTGREAGSVWQRQALLSWLREELVPHATAEEAGLYPAAAAQPGGRLLVDGMLVEHQAITALVAEIEAAGTPVDATAAARALAALFEVHLAKENNLILPLLLDAPQVSLADLLEGMHEMLGADETDGGGCGCGGCGCSQGSADAPVLAVDARLDVRSLPHAERHAQVLAAIDALPTDGALVLVAPHAPRPLLAEIDARYPGQIDTQWLQEGPDVWQIRLHRQPATV
ncbi:hypothetical protein GCM10027280_20710 [Micromonospora polyrhachis]|uniref:Uncharacterized protein (DUF2249 family)/iron-sulfur cluster repair protein YtfE (RIC family) n=1 Tax=Micromonospora polyrhachis TaxID=1282883 RepID=A0A7W7SVH8_9ACTN|nr:DUF2249 domain-containing protein [Micromonospora polyrhachis]MBB4961716.1 uncharacterized protein (DUF2249 family)/iron-sulfur cluster repair protein YtfE (RIC family) [Micromonospora polyrhachis]